MNDVASQIAVIKANSSAFASVSIRGVIGGFVVSGQIQYQDNTTRGIVLTENVEGVAASHTVALTMAGNFLSGGTFDTLPL